MATLEELIAQAKAGTAELPENFADELETAALLAMESRDETIKLREQEIATLDGKVKTYAVQNLDLIRNRPAPSQEKEVEPVLSAAEVQRNRSEAFRKALREYK